jgi:hypothetical protein
MVQFTLRNLFLAVTCFSVALASLQRVSIDKNVNTLAFLVVGVGAIGGGIGALFKRSQLGLAIGVLLALCLVFVASMGIAGGHAWTI